MTRAILTCLTCMTVTAVGLADPSPTTQPAGVRQTMRSIWHDDIAPPADRSTGDLSRAVRQLRAMVQSKPKASVRQTPRPTASVVTKAAPAAPVVSPTTQPATQPTTQPTTQPASKAGVSDKDLSLLKAMAVEKLPNAVGVADGLCRDGQYEAALAMYMRLQEHSPKDVPGDWLLFQLGNCQGRCGNYEQAVSFYQKLISGFPQSPWLAVAKVQVQLAAWHQEAKPTELLKLGATDK